MVYRKGWGITKLMVEIKDADTHGLGTSEINYPMFFLAELLEAIPPYLVGQEALWRKRPLAEVGLLFPEQQFGPGMSQKAHDLLDLLAHSEQFQQIGERTVVPIDRHRQMWHFYPRGARGEVPCISVQVADGSAFVIEAGMTLR